jgi:hypothetical protein
MAGHYSPTQLTSPCGLLFSCSMANGRGSCISWVIIPLALVWGCSSSAHFPEMTGSPQFSAAAVQGCDSLVVTVPVTTDAYTTAVTLTGLGAGSVHNAEGRTSVSVSFSIPAAGVPAGIGVFEVDLQTDQVTTKSGYDYRESTYINNYGTFSLNQEECSVDYTGGHDLSCQGNPGQTNIAAPAVIPAAAAPTACSG